MLSWATAAPAPAFSAVVDGPPELRAAFDQAALLARSAVGARVGLVTLVLPTEQRFLGVSGLPERLARTPLTHSFCQHVVATDDVFAVTDARSDPRITPEAGGAAILDLGVVGYLGVPLREADGRVVGAVCAFEDHPRDWDPSSVQALHAVASMVRTELRARAQAVSLSDGIAVSSAIVETALDGLIVMDLSGAVREFNPAAEAMFGRPAHDVLGRDMAALLVPEELRDRHRAGVARFAAGGGGAMLGARTLTDAVRADGTRFPVELTLTSTRARRRAGDPVPRGDGHGAPRELLVAHVRDRTHEVAAERARAASDTRRRRAAAQLAESQQQLRLLLDSAPTLLFAVDGHERVTLAAGAAFEALPVRGEDLVGGVCADLLRHEPTLLALVRQALDGADVDTTVTVRGRVYRTSFRPVRGDGTTGAVCVATDVTDDVQRENRLRVLADHDQLTGLLNRRAAEDLLRPMLAEGGPVALLVVDLDHFKDVNDSLGHAVGDQLLASVCTRVGTQLPDGAVFARLGGDEWLIGCRLSGPDVRAGSEDLARGVLAAVAETVVLPVVAPDDGTSSPVELVVTASIGIVRTPEHGTDLGNLVSKADSAMYLAKQTRRGTFAHYDAAHDTAPRRLSLTGRLRRAVDTGAIQVHFQPVLDLSTLRTVGFEALARWTDPDIGPVSPLEFVGLAEDTGLIAPLSDLVLDRALAAAATWPAARQDDQEPAPYVAVNVATCQLRDAGLPARVAAAAQTHRVDPSRLVLELTEGGTMDRSPVVDLVLQRFRDTGLATVIDDYGVGYSNLARLRDLSADGLISAVKLDRSFVTDLPAPRAAALVDTFLHTAATLGIATVAEGIESTEQLQSLQRSGCNRGQGWLFAQAMPAQLVAGWLTRTTRPDTGPG